MKLEDEKEHAEAIEKALYAAKERHDLYRGRVAISSLEESRLEIDRLKCLVGRIHQAIVSGNDPALSVVVVRKLLEEQI